MINDFGLTQKDTAEKLGVTPAAVCQYISKKRGKFEISDDEILKEIKTSAEKIINNGGEQVINETCRICKILIKKNVFSISLKTCYETE